MARCRVQDDLVLIVDGNPCFRTRTASALRARRFDALTESDARSALDLLDSLVSIGGDLPFVMIVDVSSQGAPDILPARALRSSGVAASIPAIIISADQLVPGEVGGGEPILRKPLTTRALVGAIQRVRMRAGVPGACRATCLFLGGGQCGRRCALGSLPASLEGGKVK
jgi:CheY-like chemotaxis protein